MNCLFAAIAAAAMLSGTELNPAISHGPCAGNAAFAGI